MERLIPDLQSLVDAERCEVEPSAHELAVVGRALAARVGGALGVAAAASLSSSASGASGATTAIGASGASGASGATAGVAAGAGTAVALKVGASVLVLGAAVAVWVPQRAPSPYRAPAAPVASATQAALPPAQAATTGEQAEPAVAVATEEFPGRPSAVRVARPVTAPLPAASDKASLPPLAEEVRLLKEAQRGLRDGQPALALSALAEHERRFPGGQLALERSAARITALCALGRRAEAARAARLFLERHPSSSLASQVRASCGGTDDPAR